MQKSLYGCSYWLKGKHASVCLQVHCTIVCTGVFLGFSPASSMFSSYNAQTTNPPLYTVVSDLPTLPVFPGVSKFFIKSPGKYLPWPFSISFFINFVIFEMSKKKIKQEVDLVFLFELFSIGKRKQSNQIDIYLTSTVS